MQPQVVTLGPLVAANAALIAASQTPTSGAALTLTGTQPDVARRILLTYGNEGSARSLLVSGTNGSGNPITETLAVPSGAGGTVATSQDFLTVTSLLPAGGGWSAAVTVGTNGVASSVWKTMDIFQAGVIDFQVVATGTINYTMQQTLDDPNNILGNANVPPVAVTVSGMGALTASADGQVKNGIYAWRCQINSGTGSLRITAVQTGMRN